MLFSTACQLGQGTVPQFRLPLVSLDVGAALLYCRLALGRFVAASFPQVIWAQLAWVKVQGE